MKPLLKSALAAMLIATAAFAQDPKPAPLPATVQPAERLSNNGWKNRFEQKLKLANEGGPYDLVLVGDSITHNWDNHGLDIQKEIFRKTKILNLGISGDRTEHVLWRMERMPWEKIKPKAFMLMIGTNNTGHSNRDSAEDIYAGVEAIIKQLRAKAPNAKIMLLAIFPRGEFANHPQRIKNALVNARLPQLADNKTVFFWDIGHKFMKEDGATINKTIMPDVLHPNKQGTRIWAETVAPTLLNWVK